jgi:hypothetical protein
MAPQPAGKAAVVTETSKGIGLAAARAPAGGSLSTIDEDWLETLTLDLVSTGGDFLIDGGSVSTW